MTEQYARRPSDVYVFMVLVTLYFVVVEVTEVSSVSSAFPQMSVMSNEEKKELKNKAVEMFNHAYGSYMNHAFPADELMPLSCKGRYRGSEPSRGDIDDTLGNFTLTLVDTLDTLAILGDLDGFDRAVRKVLKVARFDADTVVSVFETNIRVLGGLLGGHVAASYFRRKKLGMSWYKGELLTMAKEVGDRLLPAFNTSTGIPYPRVNMKHGITPKLASNRDTCTSCAGTMILEFAALSRLTGLGVYEEKARRAMDYLWSQRHQSSHLMGLVINIHNGDWIRRESGVGAGIDSYYEYLFKTYVLLGDGTYLARFNKHYGAVKRYISQGPLLVDVHMHKPTSASRNFMDALLAFWPGLQVLVGDIGPAVETHEMLYQIVQRHNFLPEAFTTDFRVHWGHHPLRPEFLESTYFLYKATSDPYYLFVGKKVLENLEEHARVPCGFAAIKDLKQLTHEDQMDSYVLAETFKYLYLLFSEKDDILMDVDDFLFTTEAHILPLTLSLGNYSWHQPKLKTEVYKLKMMSVADVPPPTDSTNSAAAPDDIYDDDDGEEGVCLNYHTMVPEGHTYPHSLREPLANLVDRTHPKIHHSGKSRLRAVDFVAGNKEHLDILRDMGIRMVTMADGRIQLLHTASEAISQSFAEDGLVFMQQMIELSKAQQHEGQHEPMIVKILAPSDVEPSYFRAGPAQFGLDLTKNAPVEGLLALADPAQACSSLNNWDQLDGKIVIVERGGCMFIEKARVLQKHGVKAGIVMDSNSGSSSEEMSLFAMSGDGTNDVEIAMVFLFRRQALELISLMDKHDGVTVQLSAAVKETKTAPEVAAQAPTRTTTNKEEPNQKQQEPEGPGSTPVSASESKSSSGPLSRADHGFYHQDYLNPSGSYTLQVGTKFLHMTIHTFPNVHEKSKSFDYEFLPDGSKLLAFSLVDKREESELLDKPNLNEMYLEVTEIMEHRTNLASLTSSSEYLKALARMMESAYFGLDRVDISALHAIFDLNSELKIRHVYPNGQVRYISTHVSTQNNVPETNQDNVPETNQDSLPEDQDTAFSKTDETQKQANTDSKEKSLPRIKVSVFPSSDEDKPKELHASKHLQNAERQSQSNDLDSHNIGLKDVKLEKPLRTQSETHKSNSDLNNDKYMSTPGGDSSQEHEDSTDSNQPSDDPASLKTEPRLPHDQGNTHEEHMSRTNKDEQKNSNSEHFQHSKALPKVDNIENSIDNSLDNIENTIDDSLDSIENSIDDSLDNIDVDESIRRLVLDKDDDFKESISDEDLLERERNEYAKEDRSSTLKTNDEL